MVSSFSLKLVNNDFFCFSVFYNRSFNGCALNSRITDLKAVIAYCKHLVKCISLSGFYTKLFYFNDIAFGYFVLLMISPSATLYCLPPVAIIAYIWHLLLSLLANYGVLSRTLKPHCAAYCNIVAQDHPYCKMFRQLFYETFYKNIPEE